MLSTLRAQRLRPYFSWLETQSDEEMAAPSESSPARAVAVMVSHKVSPELLAPDDRIPAEIDGVPVDVHVVGEISAI